MIETKNKMLQADLEKARKLKQNYKEYDCRNIWEKYGIIILYPLVLMMILSLLLFLFLNSYVSLYILMIVTYLMSLYFCLIEYLTFLKLFQKFPEFAYVYIQCQTDKTKKNNLVYRKDVQSFYNLIAKSKSIAKYRLKIKALYGILFLVLLFFTIGIIEPTAMPMFWASLILCFVYLLIDVVFMFLGKSD